MDITHVSYSIFWKIIGGLLSAFLLYASFMEFRVGELSHTLEQHKALHPQIEVRLGIVEQRMERAERDVRNHVEQFFSLQKAMLEHDKETRTLLSPKEKR